jgi:ABC-2 type transport system permease protein
MTETRGGEVYDLGYQHYDGPREGRGRARKAIFWNGVRTVLGLGRGPKAKILPFLLFASAMTPAFVMVIILSVVGPLADSIVGPAGYYQIIALVMFIFAAIMAPELLSPDRRDRVLGLYLVRPVTSTDYVVGRFLAFFAIVLVLAYSGQIVLQVGLILAASNPIDYLRDNWLDIPRFLASGVLVALFMTIVPLTVAAFTTRRTYAAVFVVGLFFISAGVADILTTTECHRDPGQARVCEPVTGDAAKWFALISIGDIPMRVNNMIFDAESDEAALTAAEELSDTIPIALYGATTIGLGTLLWWQYRRIKV